MVKHRKVTHIRCVADSLRRVWPNDQRGVATATGIVIVMGCSLAAIWFF